jgi:hypothetical protein
MTRGERTRLPAALLALLALLWLPRGAGAATQWGGNVDGQNGLGAPAVIGGSTVQNGTSQAGSKTFSASSTPGYSSVPCPGVQLDESLTASAEGSADYGVVTSKATAMAFNTPGTYNCGTGDVDNPTIGWVRAIGSGGFVDELTIDSPTLPPGSQVQVDFTAALSGILGAEHGNPVGLHAAHAILYVVAYVIEVPTAQILEQLYVGEGAAPPLPYHSIGGSQTVSRTFTIPAKVVIDMGVTADVAVQVSAGTPTSDALGDGSSTGHFYVDSPTPGVVVTSKSSYDYRSAVPPTTTTTLGSGTTTTTTLGGGGTVTTTTMPVGGCAAETGIAAIRCECAAGFPAVCAGLGSLPGVANGLHQACSTADAGAAAAGKKRKRLLGKASTKLASLARTLGRPKVAKKLPPGCAGAARAFLAEVKSRVGQLRTGH